MQDFFSQLRRFKDTTEAVHGGDPATMIGIILYGLTVRRHWFSPLTDNDDEVASVLSFAHRLAQASHESCVRAGPNRDELMDEMTSQIIDRLLGGEDVIIPVFSHRSLKHAVYVAIRKEDNIEVAVLNAGGLHGDKHVNVLKGLTVGGVQHETRYFRRCVSTRAWTIEDDEDLETFRKYVHGILNLRHEEGAERFVNTVYHESMTCDEYREDAKYLAQREQIVGNCFYRNLEWAIQWLYRFDDQSAFSLQWRTALTLDRLITPDPVGERHTRPCDHEVVTFEQSW